VLYMKNPTVLTLFKLLVMFIRVKQVGRYMYI